jgi:uncharacterized protein YoxC
MNENFIITIATSLMAVFFGLLVAVLGWIGNKIYTSLENVSRGLRDMEKELMLKLTDMDRRITRIETVHHATITAHKAK